MEELPTKQAFHRLSSERRRKLWSVAARAGVKCVEDGDKHPTIFPKSSASPHKDSLAKTQDSGVSVDIYSDTPYCNASISFSSAIPKTSYEVKAPAFTNVRRQPRCLYKFQCDRSARSQTEMEESKALLEKHLRDPRMVRSLGSQYTSADGTTGRRVLHPIQKSVITRQKEFSVGSSGLGSSLDWRSLEMAQHALLYPDGSPRGYVQGCLPPTKRYSIGEASTSDPLKSWHPSNRLGTQQTRSLFLKPHENNFFLHQTKQDDRFDQLSRPYVNITELQDFTRMHGIQDDSPSYITRSFEYPYSGNIYHRPTRNMKTGAHFYPGETITGATYRHEVPRQHGRLNMLKLNEIPYLHSHSLNTDAYSDLHWNYNRGRPERCPQFSQSHEENRFALKDYSKHRHPFWTPQPSYERKQLALYPIPPPTNEYEFLPQIQGGSGSEFQHRFPSRFGDLDESHTDYLSCTHPSYFEQTIKSNRYSSTGKVERGFTRADVHGDFQEHSTTSPINRQASGTINVSNVQPGQKRPFAATCSLQSTPEFDSGASDASDIRWRRTQFHKVRANSTDRPLLHPDFFKSSEPHPTPGTKKPDLEALQFEGEGPKPPLKSVLKNRSTSQESDSSSDFKSTRVDNGEQVDTDFKRIQFAELAKNAAKEIPSRLPVVPTTPTRSFEHEKTSRNVGSLEVEDYADYWDHSVFFAARICAVGLSGLAVLCLFSTAGASTWVYQGTGENYTHSGFWKRCSHSNRTCVHTLPFFTNRMGWQDGALCMLLLAIILGLLGTFLAFFGHLVTSLQKRLYYFHSGGEMQVVAGFVTALSLTIYHVTLLVHVQPLSGPVTLGASYICSWIAALLHLVAAFLLFLDELFDRLAQLSIRVKLIHVCLNCVIGCYARMQKQASKSRKSCVRIRATENASSNAVV